MVLSCLYFLDLKGKVLISRDYRADIDSRHAEEFMDLLLERELSVTAEDSEMSVERVQPPIFTHNGVTYCYVKYNNLYRNKACKTPKRGFIIIFFKFWECREEIPMPC
jgi:AP-1 complex subunit mu